ncbi:hypothetical protein [Streptomyces sp. NPDC047097]|uniref:hypothetical protein n=1 Tax=Streptomyces sp. NPDC047097 TaxID=3155260 RepID=UPI003405B6CD
MHTCPTCPRDTDRPGLCDRCLQRLDGDLAAIPGLYRQLDQLLAPGARTAGPAVTGSRAAPVPVDLDVLDLMTAGGPVLGPLETWVRDWASYGYATIGPGGTLDGRVQHACRTLRSDLARAAREHPAVDEFADEIRAITRTLHDRLADQPAPRRIPVQCPCGHVLRVTLHTAGETCPGCRAVYGHTAVLRLPVARQTAA